MQSSHSDVTFPHSLYSVSTHTQVTICPGKVIHHWCGVGSFSLTLQQMFLQPCSEEQRQLCRTSHWYAVREIISMGHGNSEENKFLLLYSRGGWRIESCWAPLSGGSFLVQKARLSLSYLLATLAWLSGWKDKPRLNPLVDVYLWEYFTADSMAKVIPVPGQCLVYSQPAFESTRRFWKAIAMTWR